MYNLLNIATCFDHNFGHHQALNEHSQVMKHNKIQYGSVFVNRLLSSEYVKEIYYKAMNIVTCIARQRTSRRNTRPQQ
jgi:hypothetical protein